MGDVSGPDDDDDVLVFDSRDYQSEEEATAALDAWLRAVFAGDEAASAGADSSSHEGAAATGAEYERVVTIRSDDGEAGVIDFDPSNYPTQDAALAALTSLIHTIVEGARRKIPAVPFPTSTRLQ